MPTPPPHIILDIICQENMTLPVIMVTAWLLTGNGRSARLLYLLTFSSLRQVGGWEPGSSQEVTLPLIPDEDMEINQHEHLYPVWKDFVWSQSVSGVQTKSHRDTLQMTPSWWLRMRDPVCMCITQCQWSEHYLCVGRCFIRLNETWSWSRGVYHLCVCRLTDVWCVWIQWRWSLSCCDPSQCHHTPHTFTLSGQSGHYTQPKTSGIHL